MRKIETGKSENTHSWAGLNCVDCNSKYPDGKCCECSVPICAGENSDQLSCYSTPENHGGDVVWCQSCAMKEDTKTVEMSVDTDPHYNVKDHKCKACGEMNTGDNTCQGPCGQCWSCNCDCDILSPEQRAINDLTTDIEGDREQLVFVLKQISELSDEALRLSTQIAEKEFQYAKHSHLDKEASE